MVLALAEEPTAWRYGYQLCQQLGLKPGSLYPILVRLADRGLLETTWDTDVPAGRPPRHLYQLTGPGQAPATELTATAAPTGATATQVRGLQYGTWRSLAAHLHWDLPAISAMQCSILAAHARPQMAE